MYIIYIYIYGVYTDHCRPDADVTRNTVLYSQDETHRRTESAYTLYEAADRPFVSLLQIISCAPTANNTIYATHPNRNRPFNHLPKETPGQCRNTTHSEKPTSFSFDFSCLLESNHRRSLRENQSVRFSQ